MSAVMWESSLSGASFACLLKLSCACSSGVTSRSIILCLRNSSSSLTMYFCHIRLTLEFRCLAAFGLILGPLTPSSNVFVMLANIFFAKLLFCLENIKICDSRGTKSEKVQEICISAYTRSRMSTYPHIRNLWIHIKKCWLMIVNQ